MTNSANDKAARKDQTQRPESDESADAGERGMNPPPDAPPLQRHGDALLDGSGSRQGGNPPEEERTADA